MLEQSSCSSRFRSVPAGIRLAERTNLAYEAVTNVLMPLCVEAVLANPVAVAELKVKRLSDYDDVVRDNLKTIGTYKTDLTFWRACGKLLEGKVEKTASN